MDCINNLTQQISAFWDANVSIRAADLELETDTSYIQSIKPWVLERIMHSTTSESRILDIGCGCGYLTNAIFSSGRANVRGVDISSASIAYARKRYPSIAFDCADICCYPAPMQFDLCLAIMTLNNLPCPPAFFVCVRKLLTMSGRMLLVIPHPCYWPQRHLNGQGYAYSRERPYRYAFSTRGRSDYASPILFFHRTLETYFRFIREGGFQIALLEELWDAPDSPAPDILGIELTVSH